MLELKFIKEALNFFGRVSSLGWHENNAGNLSYRLNKDEATKAAVFFNQKTFVPFSKGFTADTEGFFLVTASGCKIGEIDAAPTESLLIIEISSDKKGYFIVWGGVGSKPTSELSSHLGALGKQGEPCRKVAYHSHPEHLIALSFILPPSPAAFTRALWFSGTECALTFPEGIGAMGERVPGSDLLAQDTLAALSRFKLVVWAHHGVFSVGESFSHAFSLVDTAEKYAGIYLKILSAGFKEPPCPISRDTLITACESFGLKIDKELL
ncbi:MAG: rhamnulose-1-phosphate aldolase [Eubacteriales bacterium]